MMNLLKFEWRKLRQSKALYIVYGLGLVTITLMMLLSKIMGAKAGNATAMMTSAIGGSSMISLTGIYLALFACGDYSQHTIKNIYARGYSRTAVYFSKYLVSLLVVFAAAIMYMVYTFLLAVIFGNYVQNISAFQWGSFALQFLWLIGIHGLYFGLSTMVEKTGIAVALNLFGITLVFSLLDLLINLIFVKVDNFNFNITDYQLEYVLMPLISGQALTKAELIRALVMPLSYAVVFVGGGWLVSQRRDV